VEEYKKGTNKRRMGRWRRGEE